MAEEPIKPKGRRRKAQPATLSMWALTIGQEREDESVGVKR